MTLIGGKSCRTCRYSHRPEGASTGNMFCTRYPPQVFAVVVPQGVPRVNSAYPSINPDVPCGEYHRDDARAMTEVGAVSRA